MYTGVDGEVDGVFGNEKIEPTTKRKLDDQKRIIQELTPKLQSIIDMIDTERQVVLDFVINYVDNTDNTEEDVKAELKAAGRYRRYLDELKTKFTLALNETRRKDV